MKKHPVREQVVREMHLRRWPVLGVPSVVHQWVTIVSPEDRAAEREHVMRFADPLADPADDNPSHRSGQITPEIAFTWERHSEGSSLTVFSQKAAGDHAAQWAMVPGMETALEWVDGLPGETLRATRVYIVATDAEAKAMVPGFAFSRPELVSCHFLGRARLWSDFRLREDNYGSLLIAANELDPRDLSRAVQRLQELGNYRNKALLGLPVAQATWPTLDATEGQLTDLAKRLVDGEERDDSLMEELSRLSIDLIAVATSIGYRMSATAAYAQLVDERLTQLNIEPIDSYASLTDFTQRRFLPAMRTCTALQNRERQLSDRATKLSSLLHARIETRIENQNARLLLSMERSTAMQLRLQQLVEGLSVVALSYYTLGLLAYLINAFAAKWFNADPKLVLAIIVVPLVLAIWGLVRFVKRRLLGKPDLQSETEPAPYDEAR